VQQLTDSLLVWPTFQGCRGKNVKIQFLVNQGGTNRNRYTQRRVISLTH